MKNIKYYKKAFQDFGVFLIITSILGILLIPSYSSFRETVRQDAVDKYDSKICQEIKRMEDEINLQINTIKNITTGQDFKILSNPPAYGSSVNSAEWLESRESVRKSYSVLKSIVSLQDKSFLMFRNSDTKIDTNGAVEDFSSGNDTLWSFTVNGEKCSLDATSLQLFFKNHKGHFDETLGYRDIANGKDYELVYLLTLSALEDIGADSICVMCYDAERIIENIGFEGNETSVMITTDDDKPIYSRGEVYGISAYDSCYQSEKLNLKFYYTVSDSYISDHMKPVNFFLMILAIFFVIFGFAVTVGMTVAESYHLQRIARLTDGISDIKLSENDDKYKYLETILRNIHEKNIRVSDSVKNLTFVKLLNFKLSEHEIETVAAYFVSSVCVLMLKNTAVKYNSIEQDVSVYLKEKDIESIYVVKLSNSEFIFFIKMTSAIKDSLEDLIVFLNKERHADVRGMYGVADNINKVPVIYDKMKKSIHYLEYGSLKFIRDSEEAGETADFKAFATKGRQLYEIIRSGNEFEAKRIVYEQWYKITQDEINSEQVEPLFFSQTSMLSQIIGENNLKVVIPKFDAEKDVVSIAFEITECIEQICEKLNGTVKKEDVRISQIIDYINQRYCDSSFYMPELVGKFELSDRAIVQMLKKATGDNFSNYLSKLRIEKAKEMLVSTNVPISDVATASGFDSSNSLYKAFKKVYGVSPSMYRGSRKDTNE